MGLVRHCARCGCDYRPEIARCAECDIVLEDRFEETDPRFRGPAPSAPEADRSAPPGEYRSIYFSYAVPDIQALASLLAARGIPFLIDSGQELQEGQPPRTRYELAVRDVERAIAREELRRLGSELPAPEATASADRDFDPISGYARCPACSTGLPSGAADCPGCGLGLGGGEDARCSVCGIAVGQADLRCPGCGTSFVP